MYLYCNCYSFNHQTRIKAICFDNIEDANKSHNVIKEKLKNYESQLIRINNFFPNFINNLIIQNEFRKPVIFYTSDNSQFVKWSTVINDN